MKRIEDMWENDYIKCDNEVELRSLMELLHSMWFSWHTGESYLERNYWVDAYYHAKGRVYCTTPKEDFIIHKASEFLLLTEEQKKGNEKISWLYKIKETLDLLK